MGRPINVQKGRQGFQKTTHGKDAPSSAVRDIPTDNGNSVNKSPAPAGIDTSSITSMHSRFLAQPKPNISAGSGTGSSPGDPNGPAYVAANEARRARIRREIDDKPLMNYKYAYCPDCGQRVAVYATRNSTHSVPHEGCPYGHLYREAEFDHDRQCAEIIIGEDEGEPLNGYVVQWRDEQVEVYARTVPDAQKAAAESLKPAAGHRKVHESDLNVVLAEKGGEPHP